MVTYTFSENSHPIIRLYLSGISKRFHLRIRTKEECVTLLLFLGGSEITNQSFIENRVDSIRKIVSDDDAFPISHLYELAKDFNSVFANSGKVAFLGNGGSAAEAMHIAAEFTGKCVVDHRPLPVMCLNESQSSLTAIANDYGVDFIFSRMVEAHLKSGDILICLSTSGKSANVLNAIETALTKDVSVIIWMGDFESPSGRIEAWKVPSTSTPRIQEIHLMWGHLLAEIVEQTLN